MKPARPVGSIVALGACAAIAGVALATWPRAPVAWYEMRLRLAAPAARPAIVEGLLVAGRDGWRAQVRDRLFLFDPAAIEATAAARARGGRIALDVTLRNAGPRAVWIVGPQLLPNQRGLEDRPRSIERLAPGAALSLSEDLPQWKNGGERASALWLNEEFGLPVKRMGPPPAWTFLLPFHEQGSASAEGRAIPVKVERGP